MRRICAWCRLEMGETGTEPGTTDSICPECQADVLAALPAWCAGDDFNPFDGVMRVTEAEAARDVDLLTSALGVRHYVWRRDGAKWKKLAAMGVGK